MGLIELTDELDEALVLEPREQFDKCIIGIGRRCGQPSLVVYDRTKVVAAYAEEGMTLEEADEFVAFNTDGAWVGRGTPIMMEPIDGEEEAGVHGADT